MNNKGGQYLRDRLETLKKEGRSGVFIICGDPEIDIEWNYMIYFHSLNRIHITHDWGDEYFDADSDRLITNVLKEFEVRKDWLTLAELGINQADFLRDKLSSFLWQMVNDLRDIPPEYDEDETLKELGLKAPDSEDINNNFTLFGSSDLETDIKRFHELVSLDDNRVFSITEREFSIGKHEYESGEITYSLSLGCDDFYDDDETGARIPVISFRRVLNNYDWRNLYARTRSFVYLNFID